MKSFFRRGAALGRGGAMRKTMLVAVAGLMGAMLGLHAPVSAAEGTSVRGTYVNYGPGAILTGGFAGLTFATTNAAIDMQGNVSGTFDEWFYGRYVADGTQGGLHYTGTFIITAATAGFVAEGTIVGGTCGFAGSAGTITFVGSAAFGGYTADWVRPAARASSDSTICNPVDQPV